MTFPLLTTLGLLPILGALLTFAIGGRAGKSIAMVFALVTTAVGLAAVVLGGGWDLTEQVRWIKPIGAWYALNLDGMGKVMVLLTIVLVPVALLAEWRLGEDPDADAPARYQTSSFFGLALLLEGFALFCFMSADALLFYIFFEATLIPMYFLIGGWGGVNRGPAALKFLLFGLAGGLVMLFGIVGLYATSAAAGAPSLMLSELGNLDFSGSVGRWLFVAFFFAFALKAPMVPAHTWLPDAAAESRPGSSVLMVGILDKIGTFGMIRFCLALFPEASKWATTFVLVLALVSILYGALMAVVSRNMLRLVAYTSISHFGFMVLGIFAFTSSSISGAIIYMLAHGLSSAALFLVIGFLIMRGRSADINDYGGVRTVAPVLAGLFLVSGLATLALPGFASFIGEYLVMAGVFTRHPVIAVIATLGTVLAAVYVMLAYQRTMTGEIQTPVAKRVTTDLDGRERAALTPLIALLLVFGFMPAPMLDMISSTSEATMSAMDVADPKPPALNGGK